LVIAVKNGGFWQSAILLFFLDLIIISIRKKLIPLIKLKLKARK
jgi:hypothetical protein